MADRKEAEIILKGRFENGKAVIDATKQIDSNLKDIAGSSEKAEKESNSLVSTLKKLGAIVGIGVVVNGFKNLVKESLNAAGAMEQVNIALTTMLGSGEKAAKLQKDLIEFAKKTPFEIKGIFDSTKQLLAYGFAQEEIIPTMQTLGNVAAGVGVDMGRLALVFGQVKTAGKLMGQDLLQFTGAGVPLLDALAREALKLQGVFQPTNEQLRLATLKITKLKEEGKISFDQVRVALESLTKEGGRFYNLMENQSKTFLGTVSNMSDSFYGLKVALGEALLPVAKRVVDFLITKFSEWQKKIEDNKEQIKAFADSVVNAASTLSKALSPLVSLIGYIVSGLKVLINQPLAKWLLVAAAGFVAMKVAILAISASPFILVVTAIVASIGYLKDNFDTFSNSIKIAILEASRVFIKFQADVAVVIDAILKQLAKLSNIPGFGWTKGLSDSVSDMRESVEKDLAAIDEQIQKLSQNRLADPEIKSTTTETTNQEVNQQVKSTPAAAQPVDPEEAAKARLAAAQAEYAMLLQAQQEYLGNYELNQKNADALELENSLLKQQQKLLQNEEFAAQKRELDQMLLQDEITLEDYKMQLANMNSEARIQLLQQEYEQELADRQAKEIRMNELLLEMGTIQNEQILALKQAEFDGLYQKTIAQDERLRQLKIKKDEEDNKMTRKKGEFELKFEKFMASEQMKNAQQAANALVQLQNSKNKQLAAIGKAAAIFQITVDTAKGAMSAYQALAPIPIIGPALGAAAAAAVVAYGAERLSQVKSASYAVGTDNIPQDHMAMVHAGEMIIPATFAEAIRAGDLSLSGSGSTSNDNSSTSNSVMISFEGANFYGKMGDDEIKYIGERLGQLITENVITPIPTRRA